MLFNDDTEGNKFLHNESISTIFPKTFSLSRIIKSPENKKYADSWQNEIDDLFERGVFSISHKASAEGLWIHGSRFADLVKHEGTQFVFEKSQLVLHGFNDKRYFITDDPTVQRASQHLLLSIAVNEKSLKVISCYAVQAYGQSETTPQRLVFVKPPTKVQFINDVLLKVNHLLYSLFEAGNTGCA